MTIEELLQSPDSAEASEWLRAGEPGTRTLGELPDTETSLQLVCGLYALGAEKVTAVEIDRYDTGEENTGRLVVSLPTDRQARGRVFARCGELAQDVGYGPETDTGQNLLFVMLD